MCGKRQRSHIRGGECGAARRRSTMRWYCCLHGSLFLRAALCMLNIGAQTAFPSAPSSQASNDHGGADIACLKHLGIKSLRPAKDKRRVNNTQVRG